MKYYVTQLGREFLRESEESKARGKAAAKLHATGASMEDVNKEIIRGKASKSPKVAQKEKGYMAYQGGRAATPYTNLRAQLAAKKSGIPLSQG